jgi:hypothetical protein
MLSEPAPFSCDPLIKKSSGTTDKMYTTITTTLHIIYYTPSETHCILFHLADPDFRAPHLLNTRGEVPGFYDRAYQRFTTKTTTTTTTRELYHDETTRGRGYRHAIII